MTPKRLLTIREAAKALSVSIRTIQKFISVGSIKAIKIGRSTRIDPSEISRIQQEGVRS